MYLNKSSVHSMIIDSIYTYTSRGLYEHRCFSFLLLCMCNQETALNYKENWFTRNVTREE